MTETREFSTAAIASIATGVLLCPFSEVHEAAEYLMGHPIWTHHFADEVLHNDMQRTALEQCPGMPAEIEGVTAGNYRAKLAAIEKDFGKSVRIKRGCGLTAMLPSDGIPNHVSAIMVKTGGE